LVCLILVSINERILRKGLLIISVVLLTIIAKESPAQTTLLDQNYTIKTGRRSIESVLQEFIKQGVNLSYSDNSLPLKKIVEVNRSQRTLHQHLITIFNSERIAFEQSGNSVLLYRSKKKLRKKVTIRGLVIDKSTGELLIGAHVWIDSLEIGTSTNEYGFYSLSLRQGNYTINTSYLAHEIQSEKLILRKNLRLNFQLSSKTPELDEVVISSKNKGIELIEGQIGNHNLDPEIFSQIPYFLGEVDILQGSLLLPGITNLGEDAIGLNVRGGTTDQNLVLLDEAPIYNSSHLFGLISVFNPDAVKQTEIYKSSIPVSYGGRASSVIHVRKKEGNDKEYRVTGGTGVASTRLMVEGPIKKDISSFLISARSSFTNFSFFNFNDRLSFRESRASFHDINAKLNFKINKKNTIYLSGYLGNDRNRIGNDQLRRWGNNTATFRWNSQLNARLFLNSTAYISDYSYRTGKPNGGIGQFIGTASIINYAVKGDFTFYQSPKNTFDFGGGLTFHRLHPGNREPNPGNETFNPVDLDSEHGLEPYFYFNNKQKISDQLNLNFGLRISKLINVGAAEIFVYQDGQSREKETITDTIRYNTGNVIKTYNGVEPRISLNYQLSENSAIKASYDHTVQYLHLISNTISPSPTDIWKLSDPHIKPQLGDHLSVGFQHFLDDRTQFSVEVFGKKMEHILDYKDGADLLLNENIETELLEGEGRAYGIEFSFTKKSDKLSGWATYGLSRSERKIEGLIPQENLNGGSYFPNDFDRTHDLAIVGVYALNDNWSISSNFVYRTGRPITFPNGKYEFENSVIPNFGDRNQDRISDYHRLDLSATLRGGKRNKERKFEDYWTFSLYNVYSRRNAFSYFFRQSEEASFSTEVIKYSILGSIIPAVTYNFRL